MKPLDLNTMTPEESEQVLRDAAQQAGDKYLPAQEYRAALALVDAHARLWGVMI